jgi:hypothetical protein
MHGVHDPGKAVLRSSLVSYAGEERAPVLFRGSCGSPY